MRWFLLAVLLVALSTASPANEKSRPPLELVSIQSIMSTLEAFQNIALNNNGNRAAQYSGYNASLDYVKSVLEAETNYTITVQPFTFEVTQEISPPILEQTAPETVVYNRVRDFTVLTFSGSGLVNAPVVFGGNGCSSSDFAGFPAGRIALVARGDCDFATKTQNAVAAGALAVVVYNYDGEGVISGTLGSIQKVPVLGISYELGQAFLELSASLLVSVDNEVQTIYTSNLIADTTVGRSDRVIVVGSHLDSVPAGPGINDNGSGSATNLELATSLFKANVSLENQVRFAWWSAEELGLLGSEYYVAQALKSGEINNIALNLNFDMLGSPNYFRGVYDGKGAARLIRDASMNIEKLFTTFFDFENLAWNLTEFNGRSDYGPFIANNVPAGGLFTGAEVIKPDDWRKSFGGLANTAFDPCYHQGCDDIYNIDQEVLSQNARAAYYALTTLAEKVNLPHWLSTPNAGASENVAAYNPPKDSLFFTKA